MPTYKNTEARALGLEPVWNHDRTDYSSRMIAPGEHFVAAENEIPNGLLNAGYIVRLSSVPSGADDFDPPANAKVR